MGRYRIEFHIHTCFSHDSFLGKRAILAMCRINKIDYIVITDHNKIDGALAFKPWLESRDIRVVVGEEVMTTEGEIIGLWLSEEIKPGLSPEETISTIQRQGGAVYVPHPYDEKRKKTVLSQAALMRVASSVDCIEIHNGRNSSPAYDAEQEAAYEMVARCNPRVRKVVGEDAHCFFEIGRNYVELDEPLARDGFPANLEGAVLHRSTCHPLAHFTTRLVRALKMVNRGDFGALYRAVFR